LVFYGGRPVTSQEEKVADVFARLDRLDEKVEILKKRIEEKEREIKNQFSLNFFSN
jgi:hypothetical protein